jgi:hypothetical protein
MGKITLLDVLCRVVPAVDELWKNNRILAASLQKSFEQVETLRNQMADKELQMQRIKVLLEAERSNKPHEPRTIRPRTAAEMRRLVEHQNAEEMEQEAV